MVQLARLFVAVCTGLLGAAAHAQKPETIKIIVGYAPGGASDRAARLVGDALREKLGAIPPAHRLEGRALQPWLHGEQPAKWREFAISEYDYSMTPVAEALGIAPIDARIFMAFDGRYKFIYAEGFAPMLFDLVSDPRELVDRGADPALESQRTRLFAALNRWGRRQSQRTTLSDAQIESRRGGSEQKGILIGYWDEDELPLELRQHKQRAAY